MCCEAVYWLLSAYFPTSFMLHSMWTHSFSPFYMTSACLLQDTHAYTYCKALCSRHTVAPPDYEDPQAVTALLVDKQHTSFWAIPSNCPPTDPLPTAHQLLLCQLPTNSSSWSLGASRFILMGVGAGVTGCPGGPATWVTSPRLATSFIMQWSRARRWLSTCRTTANGGTTPHTT